MAERQEDRFARHVAVQFQKGDHAPREGNRADRGPKAHLDPTDGKDLSCVAEDPERRGIEKGRGSDEHRCQAYKRVERGH